MGLTSESLWSSISRDNARLDVHRVSRYLSKYLTKDFLMSAPLRCRRVTTSRGIKLLAKIPSETIWTLVKAPIWILLAVYGRKVSECSLDADGILESFTANLNGK